MKELYTEVEVDAPPSRVWAVLSNFAQYTEWNPFIQKAEGEPLEGTQLTIHLFPPGGKPMVFKPTVLKAVADTELRWLGRFLFPGVFDGEHIFALESLDSGKRTKLVHKEKFRGILVPLLAGSLDTHTRRGFEAMNQALKKRVEQTERR